MQYVQVPILPSRSGRVRSGGSSVRDHNNRLTPQQETDMIGYKLDPRTEAKLLIIRERHKEDQRRMRRQAKSILYFVLGYVLGLGIMAMGVLF